MLLVFFLWAIKVFLSNNFVYYYYSFLFNLGIINIFILLLTFVLLNFRVNLFTCWALFYDFFLLVFFINKFKNVKSLHFFIFLFYIYTVQNYTICVNTIRSYNTYTEFLPSLSLTNCFSFENCTINLFITNFTSYYLKSFSTLLFYKSILFISNFSFQGYIIYIVSIVNGFFMIDVLNIYYNNTVLLICTSVLLAYLVSYLFFFVKRNVF